jgi:hypothetical protein
MAKISGEQFHYQTNVETKNNMKNRNETDALNELISIEERKHANDWILLKEQFHLAYESIKPINLIKKVVHEVSASPEIKNDLVSNAIGLSTGFLSKKLLVGSSHSPVKRVFGTIFQYAIANLVSKHTDTIKSIGGNILNNFLKKSKN